MEISVNNQKHIITGKNTLADVLLGLNVRPQGLAVAVNNAVIPRAQWPTHTLQPEDKVVLIRATQGG